MFMNQMVDPPTLAEGFIRIHKVITRGLSLTVSRGTEFLNQGFPDRDVRQGYADYVQSLVSVLSAHHLGEDELAFPTLQEKHIAAPYERLGTNHMEIEMALDLVRNSLPGMAGPDPLAGFGVVVESFRRVLAIWKPHIAIEEASFSDEAIAALMNPAEQAQLNASMSKHAQEHTGPPFLVLPFVLFNLTGADREGMASSMPKAVVEELIPKEWQARWAPMRPFLLD
jgi:hypothetical protein